MVDIAALVVSHELMDSNDKKPCRGKTRKWVKRRSERRHFSNIMRQFKIEDHTGFREMFRMDVMDFEFILAQIFDLIPPPRKTWWDQSN